MRMAVKGKGIVIILHGSFRNRCRSKLIAANIVNQVINWRQSININHLRHLGRQSCTHIRHIARGKTGGPFGVEVIPGKGFNINFHPWILCHKLIRGLLDGFQPRPLGKGMPECNLPRKFPRFRSILRALLPLCL